MGKKSKRKASDDLPGPSSGDIADEVHHQMEETTATLVKRHKKHKKSKDKDQDVEQNPTEDLAFPDEEKAKKKKKKRKAGDEDAVEEETTPPELKKRKLKNETDISDKSSPVGPNESGSAEAVSSDTCLKKAKKEKKKKKKAVENGEGTALGVPSINSGISDSVSHIKESTSDIHSCCDSLRKAGEANEKQKKDKKKLTQNKDVTSESDALPEASVKVSVSEPSSEKKKKKKQQDDEKLFVVNNSEETVQNNRSKKKKKHKKNKSELEVEASQNGLADVFQEKVTNVSAVTERKDKKTESVEERESEGEGAHEWENNNEETKTKTKDKKKKKKKEKSSEGTCPVGISNSDCEDSAEIVKEKKMSKKKKKDKDREENRFQTERAGSDCKEQIPETHQEEKKKKKKKSRTKEQQDGVENNAKIFSDNIKLDNHEQEDTTSITPGEPQTVPGQSESLPSGTVGQWSTNMFQDSERQNKFLRLLGGFRKAGEGSPTVSGPKKGLYGSLQLKQDSGTGGQRALTHQAAQAMDQRLESDYERALAFSARGQRGVGLGFTPDPAEGKKFHIDVNRVASKKFD